jgi:hypothetical protein
VDRVRRAAGERFDRLELAFNLSAVGDVDAQLARWAGLDLAQLKAAGAVGVLTGSVEQMADHLQRLRSDFGVSYLATSASFAEALAPVVERLAGR